MNLKISPEKILDSRVVVMNKGSYLARYQAPLGNVYPPSSTWQINETTLRVSLKKGMKSDILTLILPLV
jgi:hypothetical protein